MLVMRIKRKVDFEWERSRMSQQQSRPEERSQEQEAGTSGVLETGRDSPTGWSQRRGSPWALPATPLSPTASPRHPPAHTWRTWSLRITHRAPSPGRSRSPRLRRASSTTSLRPSSHIYTPSLSPCRTPCSLCCQMTPSSHRPTAPARGRHRATSRGCSRLLGTPVSGVRGGRGGGEGQTAGAASGSLVSGPGGLYEVLIRFPEGLQSGARASGSGF